MTGVKQKRSKDQEAKEPIRDETHQTQLVDDLGSSDVAHDRLINRLNYKPLINDQTIYTPTPCINIKSHHFPITTR